MHFCSAIGLHFPRSFEFVMYFILLFHPGVIVHTDEPEGKRPYVYYDIKQFPHDTNLTIDCLVMCVTGKQGQAG